MPREICRHCEGLGYVPEGTSSSRMLGYVMIACVLFYGGMGLGVAIGRWVSW